MNRPSVPAVLGLASLTLATACVHASEGHDHGDAPVTTAGTALPRFTAVSESFELVGVLTGRQITLYLDRTGDNSPVRDAQIELDIGGARLKATKHGEGDYEVALAETPRAGLLPITAKVLADNETDLLAGELDLHDDAYADAAAHARSWLGYLGWALGGLAALALVAWAVRRLMGSRNLRAGAAA